MDIIEEIVTGKHDEDLDDIIEAARDRRKQKARAIKFKLKKGDTFEIVGEDVRPVYLKGLQFVTEKVNPTTIHGKPPKDANLDAYGRYKDGIRVPFEMIEKV